MRLRFFRFPRFERKTLRQFWTITIPFFRGDARRKGRFMVAFLVLMLLAVTGVSLLMSYAGRDMMSALSDRDRKGFLIGLYWYLAAIALAVPIGVFYRFTEERLALLWRQWLTQHLIRKYFAKRSFYHLRTATGIDNPDQRITEDVKNFTATSLSFLLIIANSILTLIAFLAVLWTITPVLVYALLLYSVVGSLLAILIGRRLVRLHFRQFKREATLRYGLIRTRDNAESIAFYRGEPREVVDLFRKLSSVVRNTKFIIGWNRNLAFFSNGYNYIALLVPTVIVAPLFFDGQVDFGAVGQAGGAFAQVLAALSLIISQFERLSAFTAGVKRLGEFWDAVQGESTLDQEDEGELKIEEQERLALKDVTVYTPKRERELIRDLSLNLQQGSGLLVMGGSGSGKSSLLRTIAGLWNTGEGTIRRPNLKEMVFLPQRPYMISGTLRAQLMYPRKARGGSDDELLDILRKVNLSDLIERVGGNLDKELDWSNILSLGEQQRLSFARILMMDPIIAFLDEATSALDEENERILYALLRELEISFVSVGHRASLEQYHDYLLYLEGTEWELRKISHPPREDPK